jgi:AGCS family alanine or glycine:cation symporter
MFEFLEAFDHVLWSYLGVPAVMVIGVWLGLKSRFVQIRKFPTVVRIFWNFLTEKSDGRARGVSPLQAFFACIGGCVGVGNVVAICTAVQIGGPGALFWIWVTAIFGMLVKYAEVFLGMKYRVLSSDEGYAGGPHYYISRVFKTAFVPGLIAFLLCLYGVEVYQFSVVTHSISYNFGLNHTFVTLAFLSLVLYAGWGGVKRVGNIASWVIPIFVILYVSMGSWVFISNFSHLGEVFSDVFYYAFTPTGAMGGFIGSGLMLTISQGVKRGCYTGDIGVGYAGVIHSESSVMRPEKQASLVIFDIFVDTFLVCTTSVMLILTTGVWSEPMEASLLVQTALGQYFSHMNYFMPFFLFLLGYSTINAYFVVGMKCSMFLSPRWGKRLFSLYSALILFIFSYISTVQAQTVMAIVGGLLLVINCWGIFKLRHEIGFELEDPIKEPLEDSTPLLQES